MNIGSKVLYACALMDLTRARFPLKLDFFNDMSASVGRVLQLVEFANERVDCEVR